MDDSKDSQSGDKSIDVIFSPQIIDSSEELPIDEWSSLEFEVPVINKKKNLYNDGLYDPGSGEVCGKYISMSASSVLRHPYYCYPAITDPGIENALLKPEEMIVYTDDGQDLYLATCKEMNQCPVKRFHKGLGERKIDLRYYCVSPNGIRAMAIALRYNKTVTEFNLTDNFLNHDASYHLGDMLLTNSTLIDLNLNGCRIGPDGTKQLFSNLPYNRALKHLNLSQNQLGDDGVEHIANAVRYGIDLKKINLSHNNISGRGALLLGEAFETHNKFTDIHLSWNQLYTPGINRFLVQLSESLCLQVLDLSWNALGGPLIGLALAGILMCPLLKELNLSNNKLEGEAINHIVNNLRKAKKLTMLNLSYNPLTPRDALNVLNKVNLKTSVIQQLFMDNIFINGEFLSLLGLIKKKISKQNLIVTYGGVVGGYIPTVPNAKELVLNRVEYIAKMPKKNKVDIALVVLQLQRDKLNKISIKDFTTVLKSEGLTLDDDLVSEIAHLFPGPGKNVINIDSLVEYIRRKWPDRKLPPAKPPKLESEPESESRGTGKGKDKDKAKEKGKGKK